MSTSAGSSAIVYCISTLDVRGCLVLGRWYKFTYPESASGLQGSRYKTLYICVANNHDRGVNRDVTRILFLRVIRYSSLQYYTLIHRLGD